MDAPERISDRIEKWSQADEPKTLGTLIDVFEEKSFAVIFVILLGVPALPLPTGGATHVFEVIAVLLAFELMAGRDTVWLPRRWQRIELAGSARFVTGLLKLIRWLERFSRPRLTFLFNHRISNFVFGLLIMILSIGAFVAPPFSGLDTLPALGGVLVALAVLLEDFAVMVVAVSIGTSGILLEIALGRAAFNGVKALVSAVFL
ncbi:MAG: exopolysaccharide biosynthesis protein [Solirubrobacteraceae bacterium]